MCGVERVDVCRHVVKGKVRELGDSQGLSGTFCLLTFVSADMICRSRAVNTPLPASRARRRPGRPHAFQFRPFAIEARRQTLVILHLVPCVVMARD
jgi:hypothetical protein